MARSRRSSPQVVAALRDAVKVVAVRVHGDHRRHPSAPRPTAFTTVRATSRGSSSARHARPRPGPTTRGGARTAWTRRAQGGRGGTTVERISRSPRGGRPGSKKSAAESRLVGGSAPPLAMPSAGRAWPLRRRSRRHDSSSCAPSPQVTPSLPPTRRRARGSRPAARGHRAARGAPRGRRPPRLGDTTRGRPAGLGDHHRASGQRRRGPSRAHAEARSGGRPARPREYRTGAAEVGPRPGGRARRRGGGGGRNPREGLAGQLRLRRSRAQVAPGCLGAELMRSRGLAPARSTSSATTSPRGSQAVRHGLGAGDPARGAPWRLARERAGRRPGSVS